MSTAITVNTLNVTVSSSSAANPFAVTAGDTVALQVVQTNTTPIVATNITTICQ